MNSESNTPFFSRELLPCIIKYDRFKEADNQFNWSTEIKEFYHYVSDIVHVKGPEKGFQNLNKTNFYLSGTTLVNINKDTIIQFFNDFNYRMTFR